MNQISLPDYLRQSLHSLEGTRASRIQGELRRAFAQASKADIQGLASRVPTHFVGAAGRRANSVVGLLKSGAALIGSAVIEIEDGVKSARRGEFAAHAKARVGAAAQNTAEFSKRAYATAVTLKRAAAQDPTGFATTVLVLAAGFQVGGGGVDGNGGVPDMDIALFGIGGHRSILTHSILPGIAIETAARILVDVVSTLRDKLPLDRDPIFNGIIKIIEDANKGISAGIAYHLAVDGLVQPAAYHDLPVTEVPLAVHQSIFVANAAVEGGAAAQNGRTQSGGATKTIKKRHVRPGDVKWSESATPGQPKSQKA